MSTETRAVEFWHKYYSEDPDFPPSEAACQFAEAYAAEVSKVGNGRCNTLLGDGTLCDNALPCVEHNNPPAAVPQQSAEPSAPRCPKCQSKARFYVACEECHTTTEMFLASRQSTEGWVRVEDGLPDEAQKIEILICDESVAVEQWPTTGYQIDSRWWCGVPGHYVNCESEHWKVTHWRPLPAPPQSTPQGGAE